ncbi:hypothetical protein D3C71_1808640 [compost metagenome]
MIGIDQRAIRHAHPHTGGLELAQTQGLQVERHPLDTPGMYQRQMSHTLVGPSLPASLLLELLRGQQSPRSP